MSGGEAWLLIVLLAAATIALKAGGPVATGGRVLPPRAAAVIALLPAALLAALVITGTLTDAGGQPAVDASAVGVLGAAAVVWRTGSVLLAVVVAASATALLRLAF